MAQGKQGLPPAALIGVIAVVVMVAVGPSLLRRGTQSETPAPARDTLPAAGPAAAEAEGPEWAPLRTALGAYLDDLDRIVQYNRPALLAFSDTISIAELNEFRELSRRIHQELDAARRRLPVMQTRAPAALASALGLARTAASNIEVAVPRVAGQQRVESDDTNIPRREDTSRALQQAQQAIQEARTYLRGAGQPAGR